MNHEHKIYISRQEWQDIVSYIAGGPPPMATSALFKTYREIKSCHGVLLNAEIEVESGT